MRKKERASEDEEREVSWYTKHVACKKQEGVALRARACVDTREIDRNQQRLQSERLPVETLPPLLSSALLYFYTLHLPLLQVPPGAFKVYVNNTESRRWCVCVCVCVCVWSMYVLLC